MSHKYKLKYKFDVDVGNYSKEEIKEADRGGADAIILTSILYPEDGSLSVYFQSFDGRNEGKDLEDKELFKVWALLANRLGRSETLTGKKQQLAQFVHDQISELIKAAG